MKVGRGHLVILAITGSFSVYLIPLLGPHAVWLWGESLWREVTRRAGGKNTEWIAVDLVLALVIQCAAGFLLYRFLQKPRWTRGAVLVASVPVFVATVYMMYMFLLPQHFLIERDTAVEVNHLGSGCTLSGSSLVPNPSAYSLGEAGRVLAVQPLSGPTRYTLMDASCQTKQLDVPYGYETSILGVLPSGEAVYLTHDYKRQTRTWWRQGLPGTKVASLSEPSDYSEADGGPVVSANGSFIAWVQKAPGTTDPSPRHIAIGNLAKNTDVQYIELPDFWPSGVTLISVNDAGTEVTASSIDGEVFVMGVDGKRRRIFRRSERGISVQPTTFQRSAAGWLAWDAYKDNEPYSMAWQLAGSSGTYRLPRGRSITSAAVDPAGQYVAVSATTTYSIGAVKDLVLVLRADDHSEVFRKYLPTYSRSQVAFLAPKWFAYDEGGIVRVLQLPQ